MFDLNITWSPTPGPSSSDTYLDTLLAHAARIGYKTIALSTSIQAPVPVQPSAPPALPSNITSLSKPPTTTAPSRHPTILRRATVILDDPSQNHRLKTLVPLYDILAIRPTTEKAFLSACLNIAEFPLISLDLTVRHPYPFRPKPCMAAVGRGIRFEVNYSELVRSTDASARATWISNFVSLTRATRGRGIVISSGSRDNTRAMDLRAPADLVNLLEVFGLPRERGTEALREIPRGVVVNEGAKRTGFRGVVNVVKTAKRADDATEKKRKAEEAGELQISKRQAQKQKAAAKAAALAA